MKRIFIVLSIFCFCITKSFSQSGCVIYYGAGNYDSWIYTTPATSGTTTVNCNGTSVPNYVNTNRVARTCNMHNPNPESARTCVVGGTSCGRLYQVDMIPCPLDKNLWLLILSSVAFTLNILGSKEHKQLKI